MNFAMLKWGRTKKKKKRHEFYQIVFKWKIVRERWNICYRWISSDKEINLEAFDEMKCLRFFFFFWLISSSCNHHCRCRFYTWKCLSVHRLSSKVKMGHHIDGVFDISDSIWRIAFVNNFVQNCGINHNTIRTFSW